MTDAWCILRCSNCKTLDLAASLNEAGFEAWSPVETLHRGEKREVVRIPLTPSFVFAHADRLLDLLALSHSLVRALPPFRLFRNFGEIAVIPAEQLEPLRMIERRRKPRGTIRPIEPGTIVRLSEGGFSGMTGTVGLVQGKYAHVSFPGLPFTVKFPCWLLREAIDEQAAVHVNKRPSEHAAKAA